MPAYTIKATGSGGSTSYTKTSRRAADQLARHLVGNGYERAAVFGEDERMALAAWALDKSGRAVHVEAPNPSRGPRRASALLLPLALEERAEIDAAAKRDDRPTTAWIRHVALRAARTP